MDKKEELLIATRNPGKAKEFEEMFSQKGYQIKTLLDYPEIEDVDETGFTFKENALLKSETIAKELNTLVIADDSGLVVPALDGAPGVFSARYAGEEKNDQANNAKLLAELGELEGEDRTAHFHCTLALSEPGRESLVVEGNVEGIIVDIPRGDNGFGYDPLFYVPEIGKTMAELEQNEKNKLSHRYRALLELDEVFDDWINNKSKGRE